MKCAIVWVKGNHRIAQADGTELAKQDMGKLELLVNVQDWSAVKLKEMIASSHRDDLPKNVEDFDLYFHDKLLQGACYLLNYRTVPFRANPSHHLTCLPSPQQCHLHRHIVNSRRCFNDYSRRAQERKVAQAPQARDEDCAQATQRCGGERCERRGVACRRQRRCPRDAAARGSPAPGRARICHYRDAKRQQHDAAPGDSAALCAANAAAGGGARFYCECVRRRDKHRRARPERFHVSEAKRTYYGCTVRYNVMVMYLWM